MRRHTTACVASLVLLAAGVLACDSSSPTEPTPTPCTYTVSPSSLSFASGGGTGSVTVTTSGTCSWTAASDRGWMAITGGATGTGNGTVSVNLTANANVAERTGALTIAGQTVAVRQDGSAPCTLDINPARASLGNDPASGSFTVTAPAHCQWSATSAVPWLTVTSGSTGTGNGTVGYAVARNTDPAPRTGGIVVAQQTFLVTQAGDAALTCEYVLSQIEFTPCMSVPFALTATISTQGGCTWTVESDAPWITIVDAGDGMGSDVIGFTVSDNWGLPRQGVVKVRWPTPSAGQNLRVSQAGCRYAVSTDFISFAAGGGSGTFSVIQASDPIACGGATQDACRWEARPDVPWITITTSMPSAGDNPVSFTVSPNNSGAARAGTIAVADKTVRITQGS